jgi:hypothetical protein
MRAKFINEESISNFFKPKENIEIIQSVRETVKNVIASSHHLERFYKASDFESLFKSTRNLYVYRCKRYCHPLINLLNSAIFKDIIIILDYVNEDTGDVQSAYTLQELQNKDIKEIPKIIEVDSDVIYNKDELRELIDLLLKGIGMNESVKNVLKPKNREDLMSTLKDYKMGSFNLNSFFSLIDYNEAKILRDVCKEIKVNPKDMEIAQLRAGVKSILERAFLRYESDEVDHIETAFNRKVYEYSYKYKIIRFGFDGDFHYYAYPRENFNQLLMTLINI